MESLKAFFLRSSLIGVGSSWEFDATFWDFIHGLDQCLGVWFLLFLFAFGTLHMLLMFLVLCLLVDTFIIFLFLFAYSPYWLKDKFLYLTHMRWEGSSSIILLPCACFKKNSLSKVGLLCKF